MSKIRKRLFGTKRMAVVSSAIIALVIVTSAFAAWTVLKSNQTGSARSAAAPTAADIIVEGASQSEFDAEGGDYALPGQDGDAVWKITNNHPYPLKIASVSVLALWDFGTCSGGQASVNPGAVGTPAGFDPNTISIPGGGGVVFFKVDNAYTLDAGSDPSDCAGMEFYPKATFTFGT